MKGRSRRQAVGRVGGSFGEKTSLDGSSRESLFHNMGIQMDAKKHASRRTRCWNFD